MDRALMAGPGTGHAFDIYLAQSASPTPSHGS
jgi:hypothetical protein